MAGAGLRVNRAFCWQAQHDAWGRCRRVVLGPGAGRIGPLRGVGALRSAGSTAIVALLVRAVAALR